MRLACSYQFGRRNVDLEDVPAVSCCLALDTESLRHGRHGRPSGPIPKGLWSIASGYPCLSYWYKYSGFRRLAVSQHSLIFKYLYHGLFLVIFTSSTNSLLLFLERCPFSSSINQYSLGYHSTQPVCSLPPLREGDDTGSPLAAADSISSSVSTCPTRSWGPFRPCSGQEWSVLGSARFEPHFQPRLIVS
jgi:hypothetical protein